MQRLPPVVITLRTDARFHIAANGHSNCSWREWPLYGILREGSICDPDGAVPLTTFRPHRLGWRNRPVTAIEPIASASMLLIPLSMGVK